MQMPDSIIAGRLGHRLGSITSRYTHLSDPALIEASDRVANEPMRLMQKGLVPLKSWERKLPHFPDPHVLLALHIICLLLGSGPPAIFGFVISIIVNAI